MEGATANFYVHYQVDDDEVATVLSLDEYDGDDDASWLLLESVATERVSASGDHVRHL